MPSDICRISIWKALVLELLGEVVPKPDRSAEPNRDEISRLKGLKGRPDIKPGKALAEWKRPGQQKACPVVREAPVAQARRNTAPDIVDDRVIEAEVPEGSRFKGYQISPFRTLFFCWQAAVIRFRRERWASRRMDPPWWHRCPDASTAIRATSGAGFVLAPVLQGQVTAGADGHRWP